MPNCHKCDDLITIEYGYICGKTGHPLENGYAMMYHSKRCSQEAPLIRTLNLGCGSEKFGTDRVDISPQSSATKVFDVEIGIPYPDETFDIIYSRNLLEHLKNVGFHLSECYRVMKPNGRIIIITDNAECSRYYTLGTHTGAYKGHRKFVTDNGDRHFCLFTAEHLKNHFKSAGFEDVQTSYVDTDFLPTMMLDKIMRSLKLADAYPRIKVEAVKLCLVTQTNSN